MLLGGLPGSGTFDWPGEAIVAGAGLAAAGLAGLVGLHGVQSWGDRQAERIDASTRDHRARAYEQMLAHVVASFTPHGAPYDREFLIRGMAASWSSERTSTAFGDWLRYGAAYAGQSDRAPKAHSFEIVWRLITAMRADIDPHSRVSKDAVMATIFNDYRAQEHNPHGIERLIVPESGVAYVPEPV